LTELKQPERHPPLIIPRDEHTLSRANVSKNALKVLYRLKDAGYQGFLVGGGVRDLLLGRRPKDFDVATDARPEEVKALFRNSRLIGRRFRLAHVRFGREIIEVATFRASGQNAESDQREMCSETGRIISDNVYGTIEEDAWRRDFTVNALYYNISDYSIWAFAGGLDDLKAKRLRLIGDPETRYREDPVRMLRAARFAAKLGFHVDDDAADPIAELGRLVDDVPPARLFDEFLKMFQSGYALASFQQLRALGLFGHLFPDTENALESGGQYDDLGLIEHALGNTDQRIVDGKPITPMFLFGVFLWRSIQQRATELTDGRDGFSETQALIAATSEVSIRQAQRIALPRRFGLPMREMVLLQPRFLKKKGRRAVSLLGHPRFRAAYDLMLLRESIGEVSADIAEFWTDVQTQSVAEQRETLGISAHRRSGPRRRRPEAAS
jgi:poly(A) polymerase